MINRVSKLKLRMINVIIYELANYFDIPICLSITLFRIKKNKYFPDLVITTRYSTSHV